MNGTFFAVSTGPGNPELLTVQAAGILNSCGVLFYPKSEKNTIALDSLANLDLSQKTLVPCDFSMKGEGSDSEYKKIVEKCTEFLKSGEDVAMISIGDVSLYSTASRTANLIQDLGFKIRFISGINSFSEAACQTAISLCEKDESLTIIPGDSYYTKRKLENALKAEGTKILMKIGKHLKEIISILQELNLIPKSTLVQKASLENQKIFNGAELLKMCETDFENAYLSVLIVKN